VLSIAPLRLGDCPSFYRPRGGSLQASHAVLATCDGVAYSAAKWTAVLANPASGGTSWHALYPSRSGFEGGCVGVARSVAARVLIRGCCCREAVRGTAAGVAMSRRRSLPQRRRWRCSARDGVVMAGMAAQGRWRRR
jgi:hypothetical protein